MSDTADLPPSVDALVAAVTSAPTPSERSARVREWLAAAPSAEQLAEAHRQLERRDRACARLVQEHQADIERTRRQDAIAQEWRVRIEALLAAPTLDMTAATNWQRDAARAGAPLSREPLATLKTRLMEAMRQVEDLQRRSQVQREAAVLLAQRIEVLSAKSWRDADHAASGLEGDIAHWLAQRQSLSEQPGWASVPERFVQQLTQANDQLQLVWRTFSEAIAAARTAAQDEAAPLPGVAVWDEEIRIQRGEIPAPAAVAPATAEAAPEGASAAAAQPLTRTPEQRRADAHAHIQAALSKYTAARATEGLHPDQIQALFEPLATALRHQGRWLSAEQVAELHNALVAAGFEAGWQPEHAEAERQRLLAAAQKLEADTEVSAPKLQNALRDVRAQWKAIDHLYPAQSALWKQFDLACNNAYVRVQAWLEQTRGQAQQHRAQRQALIEEVRLWGEQLAANPSPDWREAGRHIGQFLQRWREGGHVGEKVFAELQPQWKQALASAEAPLKAAQKASQERRSALIEAAQAQADAPALDIEAIKSLQERWKLEAQSVPLERKLEQKLWEAFRTPIDQAFQRHPAPARGGHRGERHGDRHSERPARAAAPALSAEQRQALPAADRAVLDAADAVAAAIQSGDANAIRTALAALEAARQNPAVEATATAAETAATAAPQPAAANPAEPVAPAEAAASAAPAAPKVVRAVRGDDRPGARAAAPAPAARERSRDARFADRSSGRNPRGAAAASSVRGPRLGDAAFRAQRYAAEEAEAALRRLSAQAHGQALTELGAAWAARDGERVPAAAALGKLPAAARAAWVAAVAAPAGSAAPDAALLRLEIAADIPSPAAHQAERRAAQLQLLTQRNKAATPAETWREDAAAALAAAHSPAAERRLSAALKALLKI